MFLCFLSLLEQENKNKKTLKILDIFENLSCKAFHYYYYHYYYLLPTT